MYNKAILMGRLTADPELKQTPGGVAVTSFSLAVNRSYAGKDGERQADFLDIVAWRGTAEFICRYFSKGKPVLIEGEIQTRACTDKQGRKRKAREIVADSARFVDSKNASPGTDATPPPASSSYNGADGFAKVDDDGDLPF